MQGSCAALWKSELGRNQRSDFGQAGRAILDCSFLLCEMGGRNAGPTSRSCHVPGAPRRQAQERPGA